MTATPGHNKTLGRRPLLAAALIVGFFLTILPLHAQLLHASNGPLPSFEVASIKPGNPDDTSLGFRMVAAGLNVQNASLIDLIRFAYMVKSTAQLPKGPHWSDSDKFNINAKIGESQMEAMKKLPPDQRFDQYRLMVQSLLADRFDLKLTVESKDLPVYALVLARGGSKLKESGGLTPPPGATKRMPGLMGGRGQLKASAMTMPFFTDWVSRQPEMGDRVVIDKTGLEGTYDFELNWSPDDGRTPLLNGVPQESTGPSIFTAFQEQLGLKLESQKAPVEVLVIDQVERPSEN
jgi:uncharacterized protein (TIGR03435 family)